MSRFFKGTKIMCPECGGVNWKSKGKRGHASHTCGRCGFVKRDGERHIVRKGGFSAKVERVENVPLRG